METRVDEGQAGMRRSLRLSDASPELERLLSVGGQAEEPQFGAAAIRCETVYVRMRDGVRLATDIYRPAGGTAPVVVLRTPYGRATDQAVGTMVALARRGYVAVSQDCRGTGDSEPDSWDYYVYEADDSYDCVAWIVGQPWYADFIGAFGGSYNGQTQWAMATHPAMSALVPHVSGLGIAVNTVHLHLFINGYARTVGKGADKLKNVHYTEIEKLIDEETRSTGLFNEPLFTPFSDTLTSRFPEIRELSHGEAARWLWSRYCEFSCEERARFIKDAFSVDHITILEVEALARVFGQHISHDALTVPAIDAIAACRAICAPALMVTGWYDWGLNDALATWHALQENGREEVRRRCKIIIGPYAHNTLGYLEGVHGIPALKVAPSVVAQSGILTRWYRAVKDGATDAWPTVIYYLMGANEWRISEAWPPSDLQELSLYLHAGGVLTTAPPEAEELPDTYTYNPEEPTPTVGGSIVSFLYPVGSVDVSAVQLRSDVRVYTTEPLHADVDVIGPLQMILYAASSAPDTDFAVRLSDVFPDGKAVQLQNGVLRARYRNIEPAWLVPGSVYCLEIDIWGTANRFKAGHRIRVDVSSADFPRFDRNSNVSGPSEKARPADQSIFHDAEHPSQLKMLVMQDVGRGAARISL